MDAPSPFVNTLFFGDNLDILRDFVAEASVDLVYLDPPFNSNRDYNVLFREQSGTESPAQIRAFGDTWNWAGAAPAWANFAVLCPNPKVIELMHGFHNAIGENDVLAYLVMMAPRLFHLHRVLKPTGSLYLHCDPTASAYLRLILDCLFGAKNFRNEIIWVRHEGHNDAKRFGSVHDVIFYYQKGANRLFRPVYGEYSPEQLKRYKKDAETGRMYRAENLTGAGYSANRSVEWRGVHPGANRHWMWSLEEMERLVEAGLILFRADGKPRKDGYKAYLDEMQGKPAGDVWDDIPRIANKSAERLGYPTQKPLALLERIIKASSNPGDVVLDPFCGCGTAIVAAQKLERHWIGIDVTPIATSLIQKRLYDAFGAKDVRLGDKDSMKPPVAFRLEGLPHDVAGARALYAKEPLHKDFEMWAVGLVPAIPQETKGSDKGIDGVAYFDVGTNKNAKAIVQVKGGGVKAGDVRDLRGVMTREGAALGLFVTLEPATKAMHSEALAAGYYKSPRGVGKQVPALQIRTVEELLDGRGFDFPITGADATFRKAAAVAGRGAGQTELFEGDAGEISPLTPRPPLPHGGEGEQTE